MEKHDVVCLGQKCVHTLDCVQALMAVGEAFPAVQTAQQAVSADPTWWEARQTLGRAQLNMGEVKMVMVFFLNTYHLLFVEFFIQCNTQHVRGILGGTIWFFPETYQSMSLKVSLL